LEGIAGAGVVGLELDGAVGELESSGGLAGEEVGDGGGADDVGVVGELLEVAPGEVEGGGGFVGLKEGFDVEVGGAPGGGVGVVVGAEEGEFVGPDGKALAGLG